MIVLGITGSIGMGKSTVAAMLRDMGIPVHCSDEAVRRLTGPGGPAVGALITVFPEAWDAKKKIIDKARLRALLGYDDAQWDLIESLLHPLVRESQQDFLKTQRLKGVKIAALDIPLLFETGAETRVDYTICVSAPAFLQRQRVLSRPGMTTEDFSFRLSRQMPDAEKRARADFIVQTGAGFGYTRSILEGILRRIRR